MGQNRRYGDPLSALDDPAVAPPSGGNPRHVWLNLSSAEHAPAEYPGVLIAWRRTISGTGWEAQVAHIDPAGGLHVGWHQAERLRPADTGAPKQGRPPQT